MFLFYAFIFKISQHPKLYRHGRCEEEDEEERDDVGKIGREAEGPVPDLPDKMRRWDNAWMVSVQ